MRQLCWLALAVLLAVATTWPSANAADSKTMNTRQRMQKYTDDLKDAIQKYNLPTQKSVKDQVINDLNTGFSRDIRPLQPPKGFTVQKAVDAYLSGLQDMFTLFPTEKVKAERGHYQRACSQIFKQESNRTVDFAAPRTTQDCYNLLMKYLEQSVQKFGQERTKEARTETQNALSTLFNEMVSAATVPENLDPAEQMAANIKEARIRFPVHTKALDEKNKNLVALLENAAKRIQQKAMIKK